jgi:hypothetical protein
LALAKGAMGVVTGFKVGVEVATGAALAGKLALAKGAVGVVTGFKVEVEVAATAGTSIVSLFWALGF